MHCRYCESNEVFFSKSKNYLWLLPLRIFFVIARCHTCYRLFPVRGRVLGGRHLRLRQPAHKST